MKILLSQHAKDQNKFRKIPLKYVKQTVNSPEEVLDSYRGRKLLRVKFNNKVLEVVTITDDSIITVITFYYLEE